MESNLKDMFVTLEVLDTNGSVLHKQECPKAMVGYLALSWFNPIREYKFRIVDNAGVTLGQL